MISTVSVLARTDSTVTLTWQLNKFVDVTIYYGTTSPLNEKTASHSCKVSAFHIASEFTIKDLEPHTIYYYLLVADNHFSSKTASITGSFTTLPK